MSFKSFYNNINEAIEIADVNKTKGKTDVVVFQGRINPITLGHKKVIDQMKSTNKPIVIFLVKGAKSDPKKNPLNIEEQKKMVEKSLGNDISKVFVISNGFIGEMVNTLRDNNMEPVELWTGSDRLDTYKSQANKYKKDWNTNIEVKEIKRTGDDVSASKVRQAAIDNDFKTFKSMTYNLDKQDFELLRKRLS